MFKKIIRIVKTLTVLLLVLIAIVVVIGAAQWVVKGISASVLISLALMPAGVAVTGALLLYFYMRSRLKEKESEKKSPEEGKKKKDDEKKPKGEEKDYSSLAWPIITITFLMVLGPMWWMLWQYAEVPMFVLLPSTFLLILAVVGGVLLVIDGTKMKKETRMAWAKWTFVTALLLGVPIWVTWYNIRENGGTPTRDLFRNNPFANITSIFSSPPSPKTKERKNEDKSSPRPDREPDLVIEGVTNDTWSEALPETSGKEIITFTEPSVPYWIQMPAGGGRKEKAVKVDNETKFSYGRGQSAWRFKAEEPGTKLKVLVWWEDIKKNS